MSPNRPRLYALFTALACLLLTGTSLWWNLTIIKQQSHLVAVNEARANFNKDMSFRQWGAMHGGVYVPITEQTPPNPYLRHLPERDITTPAGRELTLMNPAYMVRQMMEFHRDRYGVTGRLISLDPLNPDNRADRWEQGALRAFKAGRGEEMVEYTELDGEPHLRLIRPMFTEPECLFCHHQQGYEVGEIIGAVGVSVSTALYDELAGDNRMTIIFSHLLFAGLVLLTILALFIKEKRRLAERRESEQALVRAEREWSAAMDASEDIIYLLDLDRRIMRVNRPFCRATGREPEAVIGRHIAEIIHPQGEEVPCPVCRAQEEKRDLRLVMEPEHPDNPLGRPLEIKVNIVRDQQGRPISIMMTLHDLTTTRREMAERESLEKQLQQTQKMETMGIMAGGIAHDFNNILTPIMMHVQLAKNEAQPDSPLLNSLEQIRQAAERAAALVRQILDFSRQGQHEPMPVKLSIVIKEASKFLQSVVPANVQVETKINTKEDSLAADPTQLLQVLMNLCLNAVYAIGEKEGRLTITVDATEQLPTKLQLPPELPNRLDHNGRIEAKPSGGRWLKLQVSDTGSGIAPEHLDKIFDPFFTTKEKGEGTGMGLPMVHGVITRHGGGIAVESEPGRGTTFTVYLPALAEQAEEIAPPPDFPRGKGEHILLVDDQPAVLEAAAAGLQDIGYQTTTAHDGVEALELLRREQGKNFDLLLTDYSMPKLKGTELAAAAKVIREDLPVILCTGYNSKIDEKAAVAMGISTLMMKPLRQQTMAVEIRRVLDQRHLHQGNGFNRQ